MGTRCCLTTAAPSGSPGRFSKPRRARFEPIKLIIRCLIGSVTGAVNFSHDRWFLDRVATHILAFEGGSHVEWFAGNYQAYEVDYKRRKGHEADRVLALAPVRCS